MLWKSNSHKWMPASYQIFCLALLRFGGFLYNLLPLWVKGQTHTFYRNDQGCLGLGKKQYKGYILPWGSHDLSFVRTGKCICLGESIAWNESFIFFTGILQNFSLASPMAPENIDLTPIKSGAGKIPSTYQIHFLSWFMGWERRVNGLMFPQLHTLWME